MGTEPDLESKIWRLTGFAADSESYAAFIHADLTTRYRKKSL